MSEEIKAAKSLSIRPDDFESSMQSLQDWMLLLI
jgi:hypothetical protein